MTTSIPDSLDARGLPLSGVALRARRSTRGRPVCSRWNGAATDSLVFGICSNAYYCFGTTDKCSTKSISKRQHAIDKDAFFAVLTNWRNGSGTNRGFRVHNSSVMTYVQERTALLLREAHTARRWPNHGTIIPVK